jgi:hypothetical protein
VRGEPDGVLQPGVGDPDDAVDAFLNQALCG